MPALLDLFQYLALCVKEKGVVNPKGRTQQRSRDLLELGDEFWVRRSRCSRSNYLLELGKIQAHNTILGNVYLLYVQLVGDNRRET
jgi:hypothetical protein